MIEGKREEKREIEIRKGMIRERNEESKNEEERKK